MKISTFIINLPSSSQRRAYMQQVLSSLHFIDYQFIEAVDGRLIPDNACTKLFNLTSSKLRYGRDLNRGEIGCTLSHYKCYQQLLKSPFSHVLILEDDITIIRDLTNIEWGQIQSLLKSDIPRIILLSGDYWYWGKSHITKIYDAVGSYAYMINKAAANLIISSLNPSHVADDWHLYKQLGVKIYAIYPYAIDANIEGLPSDISQNHWGGLKKEMALKYRIRAIYNTIVKRFLNLYGHFESKKRL